MQLIAYKQIFRVNDCLQWNILHGLANLTMTDSLLVAFVNFEIVNLSR